MGGIGSGNRSGREPRRLVERCFAIEIKEILAIGLMPGTQHVIDLRAPLLAWSVRARFMIRHVHGVIVMLWFDPAVNGGFTEVSVDVPKTGSHRRRYFVCPGPDHPTNAPKHVARLYWPVADAHGFACRSCHNLSYRSSQTRRDEPLWMRRLRLNATRRIQLPVAGRDATYERAAVATW